MTSTASQKAATCADDATEEVVHLTAVDEIKARPVHPTAARWFAKMPALRHIPLFGRITEVFGPKLVISVGLCYFLSKGAAGNMINKSRQPMFMKRYKIDAIRFQRLSSMYSLGWSIKSFMAVIADAFPLLGYSKRWYLLVSAVVGGMFALVYGLLPARPSSANAAAAFVFLTCFSKANIDILTEGHYSRRMRQNPQAGPALVSWVWAMTFAGTIVSAAIMGPLSDKNRAYAGVIISAVLEAVVGIFFFFNFYGEKRNRTERRMDALLQYRAEKKAAEENAVGLPAVNEPVAPMPDATAENTKDLVQHAGAGVAADDAEYVEFVEPRVSSCLFGLFEFNQEVIVRNWRIVLLCMVMTACVITLVCVTVLGTRWQLLYTCVVVAPVLCVGAFLSLPLAIAKAAVFMYLNSIFYLQIPGALSTFYVASPRCVRGGPNFSYTFYTTVGSIVTDIAGILGAVLFTYVFSKRSYPFVFVVTTLLQIFGSVFDLIAVERWNVAVNIPDKVLYLLGDAVVYEVCFVMSIMPQQILMSRLCPRGTESMVFGLMAGFSSAGNSMSLAIGSLLMETVWPIKTKTVPCDYSNTKWLIITGHFGMPLLTIPFAFFLLPWARICDNIDKSGRVIPQEDVAQLLSAEDADAPASERLNESVDDAPISSAATAFASGPAEYIAFPKGTPKESK